MPSVDYHVRLTPAEIMHHLNSELGHSFVGSVSDKGFSLQRRRDFMKISGRVMDGIIEQTSNDMSTIHITFKTILWTRVTIIGYFVSNVALQVFFIPIFARGIMAQNDRVVLLSLIPVMFIVIGYVALRGGLWTNPSSEGDLLGALDSIFGDSKLESI